MGKRSNDKTTSPCTLPEVFFSGSIMATPKQIELTNEEREALKHRIQQSNLDEDDKSIVLGMLNFNSWLWMTEKFQQSPYHSFQPVAYVE